MFSWPLFGSALNDKCMWSELFLISYVIEIACDMCTRHKFHDRYLKLSSLSRQGPCTAGTVESPGRGWCHHRIQLSSCCVWLELCHRHGYGQLCALVGHSLWIFIHCGWLRLVFLCPRHSKNGGGALSVTPDRACIRPSVRYLNLVSAQ